MAKDHFAGDGGVGKNRRVAKISLIDYPKGRALKYTELQPTGQGTGAKGSRIGGKVRERSS
jgi:hypothetical protein